jgi:diguanylate cyclase (GGDEF)-like protein
VGSLSVLAAGLFRELTGVESTLLSRWSTELGFIFDFSVFSLGLVYRAHFTRIEHQRLEAELREATLAAGHDPLTGLLNRRGLEAWLKATVRHAGTVLFIDIDCFKEINDEGGHAAGDDVLTIVARIIRHAVREQDAVSRFGGDEFVVVLNGISDAALTTDVVARISSAVGFLVPLGAKSEARIGVSIGSATFGAGVTFSEALELADADAYRVKAEHHVRTRSVRQRSLTPPNAVAE